MCFAIPKKIFSVDKGTITTTDGIKAKYKGIALQGGDYVLVYGNMVVEKIDSSQAKKSIEEIQITEKL